MALLTSGTLLSLGGLAWKYWRVPVRLWQWYRAPETEPMVGQVWREAGLRGPHSDWQVQTLDDQHIGIKSTTDKDDFEEYLSETLSWDEWALMVKKSRLYCQRVADDPESLYWGDARE